MKQKITFSFSLLSLLLLLSCSLSAQENSTGYKSRYKEFLQNGEEIFSATHQYLVTTDKDGQYLKREFYFEPLTLTAKYYLDDEFSRHGPATFWFESGNLKRICNYEKGALTGPCKYYHSHTKNLSSQGNFEQDEREGVWKYYHQNGWLQEEKTFKYGQLEGSYLVYDSLGVIVNKKVYHDDTLFTQTNEAPKKDFIPPYLTNCSYLSDSKRQYRRSIDSLSHFVNSNIHFPEEASELNLKGKTYTTFSINTKGRIDNIEVVLARNSFFKKELERVFALLKEWEWQPGIEDGQPISTAFTLPVRFQLY